VGDPLNYRVENSGHIGYHALLRALSYLALVGGGVVAFYEHSTGLIVALGVAVGLALAVAERTRQLPGSRRSVSVVPSGLPLGDGGCFPGGAPLRENRTASSAVVIDGGSLEHERGQSLPLSASLHYRWLRPTRGLRILHQHP